MFAMPYAIVPFSEAILKPPRKANNNDRQQQGHSSLPHRQSDDKANKDDCYPSVAHPQCRQGATSRTRSRRIPNRDRVQRRLRTGAPDAQALS
jgi:hypothetical protein